jgi:hypothetical protein
MASNSVSVGLNAPPAATAVPVLTFAGVASVATSTMVLAAAKPNPDPWHVVTPLDADQVEKILCKYSLSSDWNHIIVGLCEGFDVGIREQLS